MKRQKFIFYTTLLFIGAFILSGSVSDRAYYIPSDTQVIVYDKVLENKSGEESVVSINNEIYVPLRKTFEIIGKSVTLYEDANKIVVEDYKASDDSVNSFESNFDIIASIPSEDIYVYGLKPKGVVVYYKGSSCYIDTEYFTPRMIPPEISYNDYNNDGTKDIAITFYNASGTGVSIEELHILTVKQIEVSQFVLTDNKLSNEDMLDYIKQNFDYGLDKQNKIVRIVANYKGFEYKVPDNRDINLLTNLSYGRIIDFELSESIKVNIPVSALYYNQVEGTYFGEITANISLKNNFVFENLDFIMD